MNDNRLRGMVRRLNDRYPGSVHGFGRGLCDLIIFTEAIMPWVRETREFFEATGSDKPYYRTGRTCGNIAAVLAGGALYGAAALAAYYLLG